MWTKNTVKGDIWYLHHNLLKGENGVPKGFPDKSVIKLKLELKILIVSTYVSKVDIVIPWMIILENHKDDKSL